MSTTKKILSIWSVYMLLSLVSLTLPHHYVDKMAWVSTSLQVLLLIVCVYTAKNSSPRSRPIFVNFAILFFFTFLSFNNMFIGKIIWQDWIYSEVIYHAYVSIIGTNFMLTVCLLYLSFDYFFNKWNTAQKYALTFIVTLSIFVPLFGPHLLNPLSLYEADGYARYLHVKEAYNNIVSESGTTPTNAEIQDELLSLGVNEQITENEIDRIVSYLPAGGETILFWKPVVLNIIFVNFFLVFFLSLFVIHKYRNDKPHPAYLEKMAFLFSLWCIFDAFHNLAFVTTRSLELYRTLFAMSQYLSIFTVLLLVYVFSVRLRFVLSASGKFYEEELLLRPETITRWRDEIDSLVLNFFFSPKKLWGRLVATRRPES